MTSAHVWLVLAVVVAFLVTVWLTGVIRSFALARGVIDHPNLRSSHTVPTPRGGGLAIVLVTVLAFCVLWGMGELDLDVFCALAGGGCAVAAVGFMDDRRPLPAGIRLGVHFCAALWALLWLGGIPPVQLGDLTLRLGLPGYVFGALLIVWTLNLFNFMDGIDGIAASQAAVMMGAACALWMGSQWSGAGAIFAASCLGFLVWNWAPARIFMGDAGSGFLGYILSVAAIVTARESAVGLLVWLILGGVFFVDATLTLARRLLRGERLHEAHRSHAYQNLSRRWGSHAKVTLLVVAVNVLWLIPLAAFALSHPRWAGWIAVIALVPVIAAAAWAGAGKSAS